MPRKALTSEEITDVRAAYCDAAFTLFKEADYSSVTMRRIAKSMGTSPMTAYRYFQNKDDVFAALRTTQFNRLADSLDGVASSLSPPAYLRALAEAYADYAQREPQGYRLLYMVPMPTNLDYPEMEAAQLRTQRRLFAATERAIESGHMTGDPLVVAHTLWASIHGLVSLDLAGQLNRGKGFNSLFSAMLDQLGQK